MQALILAGGRGTRLRPLTVYTPKPIVPVINRPFLLYQIEVLKRAGIFDITLSLSYQPDKIQQMLGNGIDYGVNITYITEPSPMGTGGAYKFAEEALRETTIVFNGDILTDLHIGKLVEFHTKKKAAATISLVPVDEPSRYGVVSTDKSKRVLSFVEKPDEAALAMLGTNNVNAGIYVLEPQILDIIAADTNRSFEYDVFPDTLERALPFYGCVIGKDYWIDIGSPANYLKAHHDFLAGRVKGFDIGPRAEYEAATHSEIDRVSVIGEGCIIKPGVTIKNSVIGPGVMVEEKAVIENSVIWAHSRIASAAEISGAIIGRSCHVGRNSKVGQGAVLGDKTALTDYTIV